MQLKAVLFDFDGTIADSNPGIWLALNNLFHHYGIPKVDQDTVKTNINKDAIGLLKLGFPHLDNKLLRKLTQELLEEYKEICLSEPLILFKGMDKILKFIKAHNIPCGIVSNKNTTILNILLGKSALFSNIKVVISSSNTLHSKPHPQPIFLALESINAKPNEVIFLGDGMRDMLAAKNAGAIPAFVTWGYESFHMLPENIKSSVIVIQDPSQIKALLDANFYFS